MTSVSFEERLRYSCGMSILPPQNVQSLPFYLSGPRPCPYLAGRIERKLFTHLAGESEAVGLNSALCRAGFRRSQTILYRPACADCTACVPVRIPVSGFSPSRSQRRLIAANRDLRADIRPPVFTEELFSLFSAYQRARHADSDMALMNANDFTAMLEEGCAATYLHCLFDDHARLKGCMIADHVADGVSAVYSFFDPREQKRGLGTALILALVDDARERGLPYVYLGYWIAAAKKMLYKTRFRPLEALGPDGWENIELGEKKKMEPPPSSCAKASEDKS